MLNQSLYYPTDINFLYMYVSFQKFLIFLYRTVSMDYEPLSVDLIFSENISNICVNLTTMFNADTNAMPFNVNLTTTEPAVILSPSATTINILDGRQFSIVSHNLICQNLPGNLSLSLYTSGCSQYYDSTYGPGRYHSWLKCQLHCCSCWWTSQLPVVQGWY